MSILTSPVTLAPSTIAIRGQTFPTWLCELHEDELASERRGQFKQPFNREKFFLDSLRVIESIDSENDSRTGQLLLDY